MRIVHLRSASPSARVLAALSVLVLGACGGSDPKGTEAAKKPTSTPPAQPAVQPAAVKPTDDAAKPATSSAAGAPTLTQTQTVTNEIGGARVDEPREDEPVSDKPLVASFPETKQPDQPRPKIANLPSDDELLGRPLVINDKVVPFDEVKKQVCLGSAGVNEIEGIKLEIFIAEEQKRRASAGAGKEDTELGDDEFDDYMKEIEEEVRQEYPGGEVGMEDILNGIVATDPKGKLKIQKLFEKMFLPDDPSKMPPISIEAILKQDGGDGVIDHYKTSYSERVKDGKATKKNMAERQFDSAILQQILDHLQASATIVADPAPGVLYRVNGVDIKVDDVWKRIKPFVTTMEVRAAKQWIVNTTLLQEAFKKADAWLSDAEADEAYHKHSDPYKDSIFSQERVAVVIKQFPSVDRYKQYRRLYESFDRMKKPTPEELKKHAEFRTNKVIGQVSVDVDVLLCSAFDFKTNRWKENGWADAENHMKTVLQLLVDEQRPWEEMVERFSDFYDPPMPASAKGQEDPDAPKKGKFRNFQRNNLLTQLGESEYFLFLNGTSITDFIFFEQEVGTLGQPMRGPVGWYLPRLMRRTKPPQRLQMDQSAMDEVVKDDYITWNLAQYAQQLIHDNEVYGLEIPGAPPTDRAPTKPK